MRIEGTIIVSHVIYPHTLTHLLHCLTTRPHMQGFDEFMNLVMDNAEEVFVKNVKNEVSRRPVGACH